MPEKGFSEDLIRKASRVVLHAAERRKESLFKKLTAQNAEKIARLVQEKPIFFEGQEDAPGEIILDEEIADALPPEFFENPTQWIESQQMIRRGDEKELPRGETIEELWGKPYDISKVKQFSVDFSDGTRREIVSKRIAPKQLEEIALAKKAYDAGIPTPKVLGEIIDQSNVYALFEHLPGINLNAAIERFRRKFGYHPEGHVTLIYDTDENMCRKNLDINYSFLSKEAKLKLWKIWEKGKPYFVRSEILYPLGLLLSFPHRNLREKYIKEKMDNLKQRFSENEIKDALEYAGYKSLEESINAVSLKIDEESEKERKDFFDRFNKLRISMPYKIEKRMDSVVKTDLFGFDYRKEIEKLKSLCKKKGIVHKDFERRNLMIMWDFENDCPLPRKENEPKLYVIDWEPAPRTPKK